MVYKSHTAKQKQSEDSAWLSFLKEIGYDPRNRPEVSGEIESPEESAARARRLEEFMALAKLVGQTEPIDEDFPYRSQARPVDRHPLA